LGLAILSVDGAVIEDLSISNITMRETVASPIFIRLGSRMRGPAAAPVGAIRRINISNLVSSSTSSLMCSMIAGIPGHKIENVKLSNILLQHSGGGTRYEASRQLQEKEKEYPEPNMFGNTPAHGLFIRHAQDIEVSSYTVIAPRDNRPCISLVDVAGADFFNIKTERTANAPVFVLDQVKEFRLAGCPFLPDTQLMDANHKEL
jgi:polygalacturonase